MKIIITEEEKNDIINRYGENIDNRVYNFLIRRAKVNRRSIESVLGGEPFYVTEVTFDGYPGYGFNNFRSKSDMVKVIFNMLEENDIITIDRESMSMKEFQIETQSIIRAIKKFLDNKISITNDLK